MKRTCLLYYTPFYRFCPVCFWIIVLDRKLFELFNEKLIEYGYQLNSGNMVDASFVEVPRRRVISETELKNPLEKMPKNKAVKVILEEIGDEILVHAKDEKTAYILVQTDFEARYTKKNDQTFFGYKDHICADSRPFHKRPSNSINRSSVSRQFLILRLIVIDLGSLAI